MGVFLSVTDYLAQVFRAPSSHEVVLALAATVIAVFFPIAIAVFQREDNLPYKEIDRLLILQTIAGRDFLGDVALLFSPLLVSLLRDDYWGLIRFATLAGAVLWLYGALGLFRRYMNMFEFAKGNLEEQRILLVRESVSRPGEHRKYWLSIWKNKDAENQQSLVDEFISQIDGLISRGRSGDIDATKLATLLLGDFAHSLGEREILHIVSGPFEKFLDWHARVWVDGAYRSGEPNSVEKFALSAAVRELVNAVIKNVLSKPNFSMHYPLFDFLSKHVDGNESLKSSARNGAGERYYLFDFAVSVVFSSFKDSLETVGEWTDALPDRFKITEAAISRERAGGCPKFTLGILQAFCMWAQFRVRGEDSIDHELELLARDLFPETDPIMWAHLLTFRLGSWGQGGRIRALIESPKRFGVIGRLRSFYEGAGAEEKIRAQDHAQEEATARLARVAFPETFGPAAVRRWREEFGAIPVYEEDDALERERQYVGQLISLLEAQPEA